VSDPHPARPGRPGERAPSAGDRRTLFERIVEFLSPGPDSTDELIETLADAETRELIEPESRAMLEGVIRMADMTAGDVMVAAPRMDLLDIDAPYDELLEVVIDTGHSRFPVYDGERDNVIGILMAKDLLKLHRAPELNLRALLRPAVFVPETKRLNELLRDFRSNRNHLAIVIDEFGKTAGLITIEDVLEEIVGEIEDEFDDKDGESGVYTLADGSQRVAGDAAIGEVNAVFGTTLSEDDFDTIGGLVAHELGRVPRRGEAVEVGVAMSEPVMQGLPKASGDHPEGHLDMHEFVLDMPDGNPTPFKHIGFNWNPGGHEPPGIYDQPHFDFHFYTIPRAERSAIDCADETKPSVMPAGYSLPDVTLPPPLAEMARDTILTGLCVRQMGMHSLLTAELESTETFRGTMVVGYYRGLPIFIEPMLTRSLLLEKRSFDLPIPRIPGMAGAYPRAFRAEYDARRQLYQFVFSDFATAP